MLTRLLFPGWTPRAGFALIALMLAVSTGRLHAQRSAPTEAQASATAPAADAILKVGGNVPNPIELKLSDLSAMPRTDVHATDRDGKDIAYSGVFAGGAPPGSRSKTRSRLNAKSGDRRQLHSR